MVITLCGDQGRGARVITRGMIEQKTLGVRTDLLDMNLILISQFISAPGARVTAPKLKSPAGASR